jgi:hypothetical protein
MDTNADATSRDQARLVATGRDNDYTLSLEEVAERYAKAGHARTLRTLQRYCASGHLDAQKLATTTGDKYLVTPQSVSRHIAQIQELNALNAVATGRDKPRQVATERSEEISQEMLAPEGDKARQAATGADGTAVVDVARFEREVERLEDDREFLREQIKVKDGQISSLLERDRETNILIGKLQEMLTPLLSAPRPERSEDNTGLRQ